MEDWLQELKRVILADIRPLDQGMQREARFEARPEISPASVKAWVDRIGGLSTRMRTILQSGDGPWMLSAWRLYHLLALLALGSRGQTQAELAFLIGVRPEELSDMAKGMRALDELMETRGLKPSPAMQPVFWYHKDISWEQDLRRIIDTFLAVRTEALDFDDPGKLLHLNARLHTWMAPAEPEDLARFPGWFLPVMRTDLELRWKHPFSVSNTIAYQFKVKEALTSPCLMQQQLLLIPGYETETYLGLDFPLLSESLRLRIIMPKIPGASMIIDSSLWQADWPLHKCRIGFPRMQWRQTRDLRPDLEKLGLHAIFAPLKADLSGMTRQQVSLDTWPDHQALVVHEAGIGGPYPSEQGHQSLGTATQEWWIDRPYYFSLQDLRTGMNLLEGYADASCLTLA